MRELAHEAIDILKMDIEGAEYRVIDDMLRAGIHPTQILVEFHHRHPGAGASMTKAAVAALRSHSYEVFWSSESGEEYCFIRRFGHHCCKLTPHLDQP